MSKEYNFVLELWDRFKGDPQIKLGYRLIGMSLFAATGLTFSIYYEKFKFIYDDQSGTIAWIFAGIILLLGIGIIVFRLNEIKSNPPFLLYSMGLVGMEPKPPRYALKPKDRAARDLKYSIDSYDKSKVMHIYNIMKYNFSERVEHSNASRLYIATLGSFPFQFLVGTLVRNAHAPTTLLEYDRNESKWHQLKAFCEQELPIKHLVNGRPLNIQSDVQNILSNNPQDIGIALGYTFPIPTAQIPPSLRSNTLILEHSFGHGHDKLSCKDAQKKLLDDLSQLFRLLGGSNRKIHLFVAAQSSMCVALGKNYMDNAHGSLVLYNYNNNDENYNWSIKFYRGDIS